MPIDQCIILAAGFGTRMGEMGKRLPKVMWPLFEYSLLETQIILAGTLGIRKFYINTHFQAEAITIAEELKEKFTIKFIHEEKLLGSGGGIHNILNNSSIDKEAPILVLNSDAYYMLSQKDLVRALENLTNSSAAVNLFPIPCLASESYNRLITVDNKLTKISSKDDSTQSNITYASVAICLPQRLNPSKGESSFFNTVADYKNGKVLVEPYRNWEFVDFGTSERYFSETFKVMENFKKKKKSLFYNFVSSLIVKPSLLDINHMSYNSKSKSTLNFTKSKIADVKKSDKEIIIFKYDSESEKYLDSDCSGIIHRDFFQKEVR